MASNWVFNTNYSEADRNPETGSIEGPISIISEQRRLKFHEGDQYILIEPESNSGNDNYWFTQFGRLKAIDEAVPREFSQEEIEENQRREKEGIALLPQQYVHSISIENEGELKENKEVEDYTYSLLSIYRYLNPKRHFQQQYRSLPTNDFETIIREQIYISRTAFGRFINALPKESKYDFVLYAIDHFGTVDFKGMDFIEAYRFLLQYIEENILSQGHYLVGSYNILNNDLQSTGVPVGQVGFVNQDEGLQYLPNDSGDTIAVQAQYFQEFFDLFYNAELAPETLKQVSTQDDDQKRFVTIFENKLWPVDMNT